MKKAIVILLVVILVLALGAAGVEGYRYWYNETHVFIEDAVYEEDATYIDLRGTGASMEHYLQLKAAMPDCAIDWDVPFQDEPTDCNAEALTVTTLSDEDLEMLSWFPKLRKIDATGCEDLVMIEKLQVTYPDLEVTYFVGLGTIVYPPDTTELVLEDGTYDFALLLENLAQLDFSETDRFERVLLLETRRMRRVGATVVISARLSSHMVDVMIRMRRMGPEMRLYLVTFTPDDPLVLPLISKLQQGDIEVCYVTPIPA